MITKLHKLAVLLAIVCMSAVPRASGSAAAARPAAPAGNASRAAPHTEAPAPEASKLESDVYDQWHRPLNNMSTGPRDPAETDHFGYELEAAAFFSWVEASSGTELFLEGDRDDNYSEAIDLGFDFRYYEHTYQQVYISTNGFLSFGSGSESFANRSIPANTPPDNLIAGFWDDLDVRDGKVLFERRDQENGRSFVVEWDRVYRYGSDQCLTFEIILYESGDIRFQYLELAGSLDEATVGIEDGDGVDGSLYLFNAAGLTERQAIRFVRPGPAPRLKVLPLYQSQFAEERQAEFIVEVINTNDIGSDTFDLAASVDKPGWKINILNHQTLVNLDDTDGDGAIDTGPILHNQSHEALVRLYSPGPREAGESVQVNLQVTSSDNASKRRSVEMFAAVPAPFLQAYADSATGIFAGLASKYRVHQLTLDQLFTGNTLSVAENPQGNFLYGWERNGQKTVEGGIAYYSNIEYVILNGFGEKMQPIRSLTDNESIVTLNQLVYGRYPALDSSPSGFTGVLWLQYIFDTASFLTNSNIFFAVVGREGQIAAGPINVTGNSDWGSGEDGVTMYGTPMIAATSDNRFVLAWIETSRSAGGDSSNLVAAIYSSGGDPIREPRTLVENTPGATQNIDPRLARLTDKRALLAYSIYNQTEQTYSVAYLILQSNGEILRPASIIADSSGWRLDAAQFPDGNILLAWKNPSTDQISKTVLSCTGEVINPPEDLPDPVGRIPDYVSVATSSDGYGVMTWMDAEWKDYLFYTLVDQQGQIVTQPMIWLAGSGADPLIQTSFTGHGVATYSVQLRNYVPVVRRSD